MQRISVSSGGNFSGVTIPSKKLTTASVENYADLSKGWQEYYWQPMEEFFKKQSKSS
jgi:hypothetical protein